jgi:dolichyl-phosphate-mannose-protein mannosyltransferase
VTVTLEAPFTASTPSGPADEPPDSPHPPRPVPAALRRWDDPQRAVGWMITAVVTAVAIGTRFWALGFPHTKNFDEVYYATEAQEMLRFGYEDNRGYMFIVHPPLGKWLIGLSSSVWGNDALGWRVAPAVAGVLCVVLMTRLARRMTRSNVLGGLAGLLLALDGMTLVLSRTALLDVFLELFVLAGFTALVVDRDTVRARLGALVADGAVLSRGVPTLGPRPWRLAAGVMFGAACAVKWTALSFFIGFVILSLLWDHGALRAAGVQRHWRTALRRSALPALGSLLLVPAVTYLMSYLGWFVGENGWNRHWADNHGTAAHLRLPGVRVPFDWGWVPGPIRSLGSWTLDAYRFHENLDSGHPYASKPWSWLVLGRPVDFYYDGASTSCGASSCSREVLLIGTPVMWWAFVPVLLWLAWHWFTTRDWRASAVWIAFAAGWLVWFPDLKRTMFLFYMAPLVPFLVLALTLALGTMLGPALAPSTDLVSDQAGRRRRQWGVAGVAIFLGLVIADFVWMWPIFTGGLLTYGQWHAHMWLPSWV